MNRCKTAAVMAIVTAYAVCVPAARSDSYESRITRLEAQLVAMQQELTQLKNERAQTTPTAEADEQTLDAAVERAVEKKLAQQPATLPEWVSNVRLSGDFRYRHQWIDDAGTSSDRNRHLIQARVGLYGTVNEEIEYGVRLASGNSDSPTTNNQGLGDAFSSKDIWLDLAYFDYHPQGIAGLNVYGGKINNPYTRVGNSDLLLDTDVTPEGIAVTYRTTLAEGLEVFGVAGGYYVEERALEADTSLWGSQAGATWRFGDDRKSHLTAGAGYYNYGNVKGRAGLGSNATQFYGNRSTDGRYDSDFDLVQGFAELGVPIGELPLRFFGDFMYNTRAASGRDTAYLAGVSLGRMSRPGTWALSYNYRLLEADALLGVLAEATFAGGGTDIRGHKLTAGYQLAKNTQFGLIYMPAKRTRNGESKDFDVTMVDFLIRF